MKLKTGEQLASTVCTTRVMVVRAPADEVVVTCGGAPMVPLSAGEPTVTGAPDSAHSNGTLIGKRYADEELGLELLCTKPGPGSLACNGAPLGLKVSKPLPASD